MTFLYPLGFAGLLSLPVILYLHLMHQRRRRLVVSHLDLWTFLDTQKIGPRRRRLPLIWILLLDLLVAVLFSLALAQPRLSFVPPVQNAHQQVILIDVSTSMLAWEGMGSRLAQAQAEANRLIGSAGPEDVVTVITFGRQARLVADSRQSGAAAGRGEAPGQNSRAGLAAVVGALQAGETTGEGAGSALREALALGETSLDPRLPAIFTVLSDGNFAEGPPGPNPAAGGEHSPAGGALVGFPYPLRWEVMGTALDNQAVIDLNETQRSDTRMQVFARFANFSSGFTSRQAVLEVDGKEAGRATIDLPADSSAPHVWQVGPVGASPPREVVVRLEGTDALKEDDSAAVGLQPAGDTGVALVAEQPAGQKAAAVLQQALRVIPGVELTLFTPAQYDARPAGRFDLTVFYGALPRAWPAGQVLLVDPPEAPAGGGDGASAAQGAAAFVTGPTREIPPGAALQAPNPSPLAEGIDYSGVRWGRVWTLPNLPRGFTPLLEADGTPLLLQGEVQLNTAGQPAARSQVTVLLADLGQGNFTRQAAFPILIANLVDQARQAPLPGGFLTGQALPLPAQGSYRSIQVTTPGGQRVDLTGLGDGGEWDHTLVPGLYRFKLQRADGKTLQVSAGARAGSQAESDLRPRGWARAASETGRAAEVTPVARAGAQQVDLRPWFLGAAILGLLMEAGLAWRR